MKKILDYLNPIARIGKRKYSVLFPFTTTILMTVAVEVFVNFVLHNPSSIGDFAIFIFVALIIYFSFRDGIRGGVITAVITILYYCYIMYSLHYHGAELQAGIDTTIILGILYLIIALIIGWLKQTIDKLLEREADERKRLEAIIQQLPVGVIITDNKGKITQNNKQLEEITGTKFPEGFLVGKDALLTSKQKSKQIKPQQSPIARALSTGKSISNKEFTIQRKDGKAKIVQVSASLIRNRRGKVIAAAQIVTDITEQRELEARKDDFVNMASHELKTPVTSMKLYIEILLKQLTEKQDKKAVIIVNNIKSQIENLQELVGDLLDVSRLQTGKLGFKKENFLLNELIEEIVGSIQPAVTQHIVVQKSSKFKVYADRFRTYQVLTNLITNARKYSPKETQIIISAKKVNGKAQVSVKDFGIGIAKDQHKKVFERLYQVSTPNEKTFPGLGMGLYISHEIVKRHQGKMWVESEKGKGATFYFTLPLAKHK